MISTMEKYPSWPKGLPWKGSRSLIAARGFKSLLLRICCEVSAEQTVSSLHDERQSAEQISHEFRRNHDIMRESPYSDLRATLTDPLSKGDHEIITEP